MLRTRVVFIFVYNSGSVDRVVILHKQELVILIPYIHVGGRLNKKDGLTRYDDSHVKDKTS